MDERLTEELLDELLSAPRVEDYLERRALGTPTLAQYLNQLLDESGLTRAEVLRRANIEQTFGWYAFKGQRGIGRDNAPRLAFALGLDVRRLALVVRGLLARSSWPRLCARPSR